MAEFRGDVTPIAAPSENRSVVPPPVSGQTAQNLGRALETGVKVHNTYKKGVLVGDEVGLEQLPGVGEIAEEGESRQDIASRVQQDQLKTLNQIKTAREQGVISAGRARLLTNKAIRENSSSFPGLEGTLRRAAGEFFGQFGPGEGLFTETSEESLAQKAHEEFVKSGVKAGMINPYDPANDTEGQAAWFNYQRRLTFAKGEQAILDSQIATGKVGVDTYTNAFMASDVEPTIAGIVSNFAKMQQEGGRIVDPKDMTLRLRTAEEQLVAGLNKQLVQIPGASRASIDQQIKAVRERFVGLRSMAEEGSLGEFLTNQQDLLTKAARLDMAHRLPDLFALETTFPKTGQELLRMGDRYASMTPAQRKNMLRTLPPMLQQSTRAILESKDHFAFGPLIKETLSSQVAPTDAFSKQYMDMFAINAAKSGDPTSKDDDKSVNTKSVEYVLNNIDSPLVADFITKEPAVAARIHGNPVLLQQVENHVISGQVSIDRQLQSELHEEGGSKGTFFPIDRDVPNGQLIFEDGKFDMKFTDEVLEGLEAGVEPLFESSADVDQFEASRIGAIPLFVRDLNRVHQMLKEYGPEIGVNPDKWIQEKIEEYNRQVQATIQRREAEAKNRADQEGPFPKL